MVDLECLEGLRITAEASLALSQEGKAKGGWAFYVLVSRPRGQGTGMCWVMDLVCVQLKKKNRVLQPGLH